MNMEEYQDKLDNIITRKDELQKGKETFKTNLEKLFFDFKKDSFNPLFEQLKLNIILIFDNYKNYAEAKIKESKNEVYIAVLNMKKEIEEKLKEADESYKLKQEHLKTQINIEKEKIGISLIENNLFKNCSIFENLAMKDKVIEIKEEIRPIEKSISTFALLSKIINDIVIFKLYLSSASVIGPCNFSDIGSIISSIVSGYNKAWKFFHKKEELIELSEKVKKSFMTEYDIVYLKARNMLDEDKKKIINNFCNIIDNYNYKNENSLNEIEK